MFQRILIANRGEIAVRIIRACKSLGIEAIAIFSEADRNSMHVRLADESYCIGPAAGGQSYLSIPSIIAAAEIANVDAIHPGYGFLAENAHFAEVCRECNIEFIGPSAEAISSLGDKITAKEMARAAGIPDVPGSDGIVATEQEAVTIAREIGYPVLIKATAGGGGRGMRVAHNDVSMVNGYLAAKAEADAAFNNPDVYIEKFVESARHVEIQILADRHGNVIHLYDRDCTVQRRNQKLIEEAPSPVLDAKLREKMGDAACKLTKTAGYHSVGTVEFVVDCKTKAFYFIEMNARVQVEHPVTEMITGVDIIKEQIKVCAGEVLQYRQKDIKISGHALECRINAEDPERNFAPCPGEIGMYWSPATYRVRVDSHIYSGYIVPPNYDSMLAKIIVLGDDRDDAIARMQLALDELIIEGVSTTKDFHRKVMTNSKFVAADYDTKFVEEHMDL